MKILTLKSTIFSITAFALLVVFLLNSSATFATQYYVSTAGKDSNNGTSQNTPFKTLTKVNNLTLKPGDIISLKGGQTFSYTNRSVGIKINNSGTAQAPIIVNSYGGGKAIIKSTNTIGILVEDASHIRVNNLVLRGDFVAKKFASTNEIAVATNVGVLVSSKTKDCDNVIVENVEASKFQWEGIRFDSNKASVAVKNSEIRNCKTHNNGNRGIGTSGKNGGCNKNIAISNCVSYDNHGWSAIPTGSGIHVSGSCGITIQHCVAYNNGAYNNSAAGGFGIWASSSSDVLVQFNESYNNKTGKADGGGFDMDGGVQGAVVQYNYSHGNDGAGFLVYQHIKARTLRDVTVRYNISENDGKKRKHAAIHVGSVSAPPNNTENVFIYNNTVFNNDANVASLEARKSSRDNLRNINMYNNLFIRPNGGGTYRINDSNNVEKLNNHTAGNSVVENAGQGGTLFPNKKLTDLNAYKLQSNIQVFNAGLDLTNKGINDVGSRDFYGTSIPVDGVFDIGACELDLIVGGNEPCLEKLANNTFNQENGNSVPRWKIHNGNDAVSKSSNNSNGVAHIDISNGSNADYNVQLWQDGLAVKANTVYKIKTNIRAEAARTVKLIVRPVNLPAGGRFYFEKTFNVNTSFKDFEFTFTSPVTESNVRFTFLLGKSNQDVFINEVSFKEDCSVCEPNRFLVQNTFDQQNNNAIPGWKVFSGDVASMSGSINQWGVAKLNIANSGAKNYNLQFWQDGISIDYDITYQLKVRMRAEKNRSIRIIVRPVQTIEGAVYYYLNNENVELTSDFKEYTFEFNRDTGTSNGRLSFLVGGDNADVFIDEVSISEKCDNNAKLSVTGITNPQLANIYPNPVSDLLKIQLYNQIEKAEITLFDVHGKLLQTPTNATAREVSIDVSKLLPGSYFIRIQSGDRVETQKILKF